MTRIVDMADRVISLLHVDARPLVRGVHNMKTTGIKPAYFNNIDISLLPGSNVDDTNFGAYLGAADPNIAWPVDVCFCVAGKEFNGHKNLMLITKLTSIDWVPKRVKNIAVYVNESGKHNCLVTPFFHVNGTTWRCDDKERPLMEAGTKIMFGLALWQRYEWGVSIGLPGSPSIRVNVHPSSIRKLFADREKSPGKLRRDALRNWVSDHWRKKSGDAQDETYVRKHLRGVEPFYWNGYLCRVLPAQYDLELNSKYKQQRELL